MVEDFSSHVAPWMFSNQRRGGNAQESGGGDHHGKETWAGTSPLQGQLFGVLRLRGWSCDRMITVSCVAISLSPNYVAFITDSSWNLICESHINSILSVLN